MLSLGVPSHLRISEPRVGQVLQALGTRPQTFIKIPYTRASYSRSLLIALGFIQSWHSYRAALIPFLHIYIHIHDTAFWFLIAILTLKSLSRKDNCTVGFSTRRARPTEQYIRCSLDMSTAYRRPATLFSTRGSYLGFSPARLTSSESLGPGTKEAK